MKVSTISPLFVSSGAEPRSLFLHPSPHILLERWEEAAQDQQWLLITLYASYYAGHFAWGGVGEGSLEAEFLKMLFEL